MGFIHVQRMFPCLMASMILYGLCYICHIIIINCTFEKHSQYCH